MSNVTLSEDEALDIVFDGGIAVQDVSEHRWYTRQLVVFEREGETLGFYYLEPASELQEDGDRFESDPVETFPVEAHERTVTEYLPVK